MYLQAQEIDGDFQWYDCSTPGVPISGATTRVFAAPDHGSYFVVVSSKGCTSTSDCYSAAGVGLGGNSAKTTGVKLYPNPATNEFVVATEALIARTIVIRDLTGREIRRITPGARVTTIPLREVQPGIYSIEVDTGFGISKHRLNVIR
jgi:hypothetical protein